MHRAVGPDQFCRVHGAELRSTTRDLEQRSSSQRDALLRAEEIPTLKWARDEYVDSAPATPHEVAAVCVALPGQGELAVVL